MDKNMMVRVKVDRLFLSNAGFVLLLRDTKTDRVLPIVIGTAETRAIVIQITGTEMPRPLTHDLFKNVLQDLGWQLSKVEIGQLKEATFFATLVLDNNGQEKRIDSRPSDAIALALRSSAPVYVAEEIMVSAGQHIGDFQDMPDARGMPGIQSPDGSSRPEVPELSPIESLKMDLEFAVAEERYEDAAKIRDEIARFDKTHTDN